MIESTEPSQLGYLDESDGRRILLDFYIVDLDDWSRAMRSIQQKRWGSIRQSLFFVRFKAYGRPAEVEDVFIGSYSLGDTVGVNYILQKLTNDSGIEWSLS